MNISFHGATGEVTGSCFLVETGSTKFLVDCGLFQGEKFAAEANLKPFDFIVGEINFLFLTHAHADHCGRIPKLVKDGFKGKIYSTAPTKDLAEIIMLDSAKVIKEEASQNGQEPLYNASDVGQALLHFWPLAYGEKCRLNSEITVCFRDAGHIFGSAIIEVWVDDKNSSPAKSNPSPKKLVFSGDLGNPPAPLIRDTEFIDGADILIVESTYGGRIHEPAELRVQLLRQTILNSIGRNGVLMIPVFALERTQEVLYELNYLAETRQIPAVPIFLDSPLAIAAVEIYQKYPELFDEESQERLASGDDLFNFRGLQLTRTVEQSKAINYLSPPKVILAGAGMITGGRMIYHLKLYLADPKNHLLIISYQAEGSLGRQLLAGAKYVYLAGEKIPVRAKVSAIGAYSSHADQPKILHWVKMISRPRPSQVFIVHGENKSALMLADGLKEKLGLSAIIPTVGKSYQI